MSKPVTFEPRFVDRYAGRLVEDPVIAVVELVANAWDAGATKVSIRWPDTSASQPFTITDNGTGMTDAEFSKRWCTLDYNRLEDQGVRALFPAGVSLPPRTAFGRNGRGRMAGFYFSSSYLVETWRDGTRHTYLVKKSGGDRPFSVTPIGTCSCEGHGTTIRSEKANVVNVPASTIRSEIGLRFLVDPNFSVKVDGTPVTFQDIPQKRKSEVKLVLDGVGTIKLLTFDLSEGDRTTQRHGIAWRVENRLVGDVSWQGSGHEALLDGRTKAAKRLTFVVFADVLVDAVKPDWSGFKEGHETWERVKEAVHRAVGEQLSKFTAADRAYARATVKEQYQAEVRRLPRVSKDRWQQFIHDVTEKCPTLTQKQLTEMAGVLVNLELTQSKYQLLEQLHAQDVESLDQLHEVLHKWTVAAAKEVLDEIEWRMRLLKELKDKTSDPSMDELHDLQPLFEKSLWVFGPEFETIEYTSNQGMTKVLQMLEKGSPHKGSRRRPDFVVLPDSTVGLYSFPSYDDEGGEIGVDRLVIVELKRAGLPLGDSAKSQVKKYVSELRDKGSVSGDTHIRGFVLGSSVDRWEVEPMTEGKLEIRNLTYETVIQRAESRLFKLHKRIESAPFLQDSEVEAEAKAESEADEVQGALPLDEPTD